MIDTGKGIVKVTREAFIALAEKIKNGEISVLEVAGYTVLAAGTVAAGVALFS